MEINLIPVPTPEDIGQPKSRESVMSEIVNGMRVPQNDYERELAKDIEKITAAGGIVEIPNE